MNDSSNQCFEYSKTQLIQSMMRVFIGVVKNEPFRLISWKTIEKEMVVPTQNLLLCVLIMVWLRHVQFFKRKHSLGSSSSANNFYWIRLLNTVVGSGPLSYF